MLSRIQRLVCANKEIPDLANQINECRGNYIGHHCQSHYETCPLRIAISVDETIALMRVIS